MRYGIICSDVSTEFMLCTHVKSQASKTPVLFYRLSAVLCTHVKSQASKTFYHVVHFIISFVPMSNHRLPKLGRSLSSTSPQLCTYVKSQASKTYICRLLIVTVFCTYVKSQASKTYICRLLIVTVFCTYVKSQAARFSNNIDFGEWTNCPHLLAAKSASSFASIYSMSDRDIQ